MHPKGTLENGHHGPELGAVLAPAVRPDTQHVAKYSGEGGIGGSTTVGAGRDEAVAIAVFGRLKSTQLRGNSTEQNYSGDR